MLSIFLDSLFLHRFLIYPLALSDSLLAEAWFEIGVIIFRWINVLNLLFFGCYFFYLFFCVWQDQRDLGGFWHKIGMTVFNVFSGYFLSFLAVEIG